MATERPNILLITSDQQHWDTIGTTNPRIQTPALDRLANEGTRFNRAYCPNPVCSPSRSSLITGLYPSVHGCWTIGVKLPEDVPTVGDTFMANGYATNLIGKAHFQPLASTPEETSLEAQPTLRDLDFWRGFTGPWYGFEHVEVARNHGDESHAGQHYAIWMEEKGLTNWRDYFVKWPVDPNDPIRHGAWELPAELHYTTWTAERTIAAIERNLEEDRPFFTWASFHDPHPPYVVPEPWASMYKPEDMEPGHLDPRELAAMPTWTRMTQEEHPDFSPWQETYGNHGFHSHVHTEARLREDMAIYYGMISFMDQQIGRILDALDRLGIAENTIVVFTTDHGHFLGQHGLIAKGPFHYEDMLRLPFLVRAPGRVPAGAQTDALQSLVDLAPTFLTAAGILVPGMMQGVSQLDVWEGKTDKVRDSVIVENRHQPTAVHLRTYIDERYKMTVYRGRDEGELYDLDEDPGEVRNRFADPECIGLREALYHEWVEAEIVREPTRFARIAVA